MASNRPALRALPKYDPDNDIGAVDRIRFAMINNRMDALHEPERKQFERWKQIDDIIRSKRFINVTEKEESVIGRRQLRNAVMVKYLVSWDTAERDIKNAIKLFTPAEDEKEYYRSVYIEDLEAKAEEAARDGKYAAYKEIMKLASELRDLDKPTVEVAMDKLQAFVFIIEYNPEAVGLKTIDNKDEVLARWRKRKYATDRMTQEASDAEII
jgi:hypothetical protein